MHHFVEHRYNLRLFIPSLLLTLLFLSCEENLDIEVYKHAPMIIVNCILNAGETVQMEINSSQPYPPLTDSSLTIKDATVKLYEDDNYSGDLIYNDVSHHYSLSGFIPALNHAYSIKVTAPGFHEVTSETSLPQPVPVISVDTNTVFIRFGGYTVKTLECTIKFKDPDRIKNRYKLVINRAGRYTILNYTSPGGYHSETFTTTAQRVQFFSYDLNVVYFRKSPGTSGSIDFEEENEEIWINEIYLADDSFDGMTYELKVLIPIPLKDMASPPVPGEKFTLRKLNFRLYSINEEYYRYASSNYSQVYKRNDMFSEPIQVYSNIDNGAGIFSGSSAGVDSSVVMPVYYFMPIY